MWYVPTWSRFCGTYAFFCECTKKLWKEITDWIIELGMLDYNLTDRKIIVGDLENTLGDLENTLAINTIILITKKVIYNSMKKEQKTCIQYVKNGIKKIHYQEKYRHYRKKVFDTQYILLSNVFDCNWLIWFTCIYYKILCTYLFTCTFMENEIKYFLEKKQKRLDYSPQPGCLEWEC